MDMFAVLVTNHAAVVWEEIQVGMEQVDLQGHVATKFLVHRQHVVNQLLVVFCPDVAEDVS